MGRRKGEGGRWEGEEGRGRWECVGGKVEIGRGRWWMRDRKGREGKHRGRWKVGNEDGKGR